MIICVADHFFARNLVIDDYLGALKTGRPLRAEAKAFNQTGTACHSRGIG